MRARDVKGDRASLLCAAAFGACVACGSSSNDGAAKGSDAAGTSACSQPLAVFCDGGRCDPDLAAAIARVGCADPSGYSVIEGCSGFDVLVYNAIDSASSEYFDSATHKLVALGGAGGISAEECYAGPSNFVVPKCRMAPIIALASYCYDASYAGDLGD